MTMETIQHVPPKNRFTRWAIIVAIVIVLNLFFNYTISLFYKAPQYEDFVKPTQVVGVIKTQDDCVKIGGQWTDSPVESLVAPDPAKPVLGYCDENYTNQINFNNAQKNYDKTVFIVLVVLSVISLVSALFVANETLSLAFSWGGVLSLLIASVRYWGDANNLFKVLILAAALAILIWVAVKKIK